ncbi:MAG: flippase [Actinomycetota bacterium]
MKLMRTRMRPGGPGTIRREQESDFREVARVAPVALLLKVFGAVLVFGFNVLLARLVGPDGAGLYFLALSVTSVAAVTGRVGLDFAVVRFTASHATHGEWDRVAGLHRMSVRIAIGFSAVGMLLVLAGAGFASRTVFSEPSLEAPLRLMGLSILPLAVGSLYGALLKGLRRVRDALVPESVILPVLGILILGVFGRRFGLGAATVGYLVGAGALCAVSVALWRRATPQLRGREGHFDRRLLLRTSLPLAWVAGMQLVMHYADILMVGIYLDKSAAGVYGVVLRTATLVGFILIAVNQIAPPKFAALYARGDLEGLGRLARRSSLLTTLAALPIAAPLLLAPGKVLGLFGPQFRAGAVALAILAVGQLINAATGPVGFLLIMTGHERSARNVMVAGALTFVSLNAALIPTFGINGAALSFAASGAGMMLAQARVAYRRLSIAVLPIPRRRSDHA